ncbi:bifunctional DNase/RNase [Parabacteroides sp. PFB2-10]|uniref:bifunctional nuclease family protein n=1 Tax=Parabacteroides sp. PFB2-10 TaxID=1742405 RepID=UPI002475CF99|nr:bifunctional nuclease family protein [Parabacteroides sp. PFB2-10]MDH6311733.1 bifunctional DNase/RNase [Parabacteroides sp. PFB2-10]
MDNRVQLRVQGLTNSQIQSSAYALILAEEDGPRRIPIIVGTAEAQAIAIALEHIIPPRPLTHDLFVAFMRSYGIQLREVFIYKFEDGVFYSELVFADNEREVRIDSRTSDAIAIALRVDCLIYTTEEVVKACGVVLEEDDLSAEEGEEEDLDDLDDLGDIGEIISELDPSQFANEEDLDSWLALADTETIRERLQEAIEKENYELAKVLKDELHHREQEKNEL